MKKVIAFIFILGFITNLFAGITGKISGFVTDNVTGERLPGVNIIIGGTTFGAASDENGEYYIMNIPGGTYTLEASMIGYHRFIYTNVEVAADMTTKINFALVQESIELENIEVVAEKPVVQKDLTATINVIDASKVTTLPVTNYQQVVALQTGVIVIPIRHDEAGQYGQFNTTPDDGLHFRGGRSNETQYLLNGISIKDPIWGGFSIQDLPIMGLSQMVTYTGTYNAEFGEGMSAVINMISEPIHKKPSIYVSTYTDHLSSINIEDTKTYNTEFVYQGAIPGLGDKLFVNMAGRYYTTNGRFNGYVYPYYRDTEGYDKSGKPKIVPMNYNDTYSALGSIDYQLSNSIRLVVGGMYVDQNTKYYSHAFKYNPYGAPHVNNNYWLGYAQMKHVINNNYFYDISVSRYERNFKSSIYDDLESGLIEQHILSPDLFSVSGIDYVWIKTKSQSNDVRINLMGQVTPIHQVKFGASFTQHNMDYERRNPTARDSDTTQVRMKAWEAYDRQPYALSTYIQDKMEFNEIGMILNIGLRYDRVNPETYKMKDPLRPSESEMIKTSFTDYFSPRFGVSYPISDKMALRFSYGVYYQFPHFYLAYQGTNDEEQIYPNYSLGEVTQIGDGGIKPERTTSYEAGLQIGINPKTSLNITAFYRDISGLTGLQTIYGPRTYQLFTNDAYATAKGIEIAFNSELTKNFNMFVNYTYSVSKASKQSTWYVPLFPQNRTFVSDWDIPHKLSFNLNYEHESMFGVSIIGNINTGFPYSPNSLNPNSERGPVQKNVDLNLYKNFDWFGFTQTFFVHIVNIFNEQNIWWVYPDTGKPGVDANDATSNDYTNDPTAYGAPRQIRIGLTLNY
ncbi:MAG: TonB-dependent receptor [Bacteroidetes bacterium]|nr:TonB-dependent receptor [Bacteroidota bacterium]MBU1117058.1 TonB-dependent receptor [Bacteroidota bacterium]MBU1797653.1 TonB-dependent receptor [Bacteroidota bacterium]